MQTEAQGRDAPICDSLLPQTREIAAIGERGCRDEMERLKIEKLRWIEICQQYIHVVYHIPDNIKFFVELIFGYQIIMDIHFHHHYARVIGKQTVILVILDNIFGSEKLSMAVYFVT